MNKSTSLFEDEIWTVPQVATYLKLSRAKTYYLLSRKQLPHIRIGKNVRVRKSDLMRWLDEKLEKVN
jgi:excisionase family DNA binding protein